MEYRLIVSGLVDAAPSLVVWILALILSSILVQRGGGKPERFLIIGSILMLVSTVLSIPKEAIASSLAKSSLNNVSAASIISLLNLFLGLIALAGIIFLFRAIWKKFNERIPT